MAWSFKQLQVKRFCHGRNGINDMLSIGFNFQPFDSELHASTAEHSYTIKKSNDLSLSLFVKQQFCICEQTSL